MTWAHSTIKASERTFWCSLRVLLLSISPQKKEEGQESFSWESPKEDGL